jgi:hypothetical protein
LLIDRVYQAQKTVLSQTATGFAWVNDMRGRKSQ